MMYKIKNRLAQDVWINLPDPETGMLRRGLRLPPRGTALLDEDEYRSPDVQAKLRQKPPVLSLLSSE